MSRCWKNCQHLRGISDPCGGCGREARGIEQDLVKDLGGYTGNPVTYAGGVHSMEDLLLLKELGRNRMNVTIGSALDLFGGSMKWEDVLKICSGEV